MKEASTLVPVYQAVGTVIHGRGIGKLVGMPTANLKIETDAEIPEPGVYVTRVLLNGKMQYGVTHIGTRPTVDNDMDVSIETHILNFNEEIYGYSMEIQLFDKLRCPLKFKDLSSLLEQIREDCLIAQEYWGIKPVLSRLLINLKTHQVKLDAQEVYLSAKEFDILYLLYSNPDVTFTKKEIYEAVWHEPANNSYHAVENTIFQIRKRLKTYAGGHDYVKTIIGYGYKYNMES